MYTIALDEKLKEKLKEKAEAQGFTGKRSLPVFIRKTLTEGVKQ